MLIELTERVSHHQWRIIVKRERRRQQRKTKARDRDKKLEEEQKALLSDPAYLEELEEYQQHEELAQKFEEEEAARRREEWQLRDAALHSKFLREKEKKRLQEEARLRQEELIKREWEEKQAKEKEEEEKKKEEQKALLDAATKGLGKDEDGPTHNPEPPANYLGKDVILVEREACPFFIKTGACRFGIHCSREHSYPEISTTILIPNMYSHFGMEKVAFDEYDDDASLEYSERETYEHFRDFYEDTLPEFKNCGSVMQFKVCCNASPHLRGNLYVQYSSETEAMKACSLFNGRWYAGRQLTCIFVDIPKWRGALCKLYQRNRKGCPKGGQCNFLHAFCNPGNAFWRANMDLPLHGPLQHSHASPKRSMSERGNSRSNHNRNRSRLSRSRSRASRSKSRSRTRSIRSNSRRSRSRSTDRSKKSDSHKLKKKNPGIISDQKSKSYKKSDSDSRKRSRRRSRSTSKSPLATKDKSRYTVESHKSGVNYRSKYMSRSRSRSKSLSKSPKRYACKSVSPYSSKRTRRRNNSRSPVRKKNKSRSPQRRRSSCRSPEIKSTSPCRRNNGST